MNKLLIGLLIVAAGTGIFFLLQKKRQQPVSNAINKELIIGKWKADAVKDPAFNQNIYDFLKDGNIVRSLNDSAKADTSLYEWNMNNELLWKEKGNDSTSEIFSVLKLTQDSLQLQSYDSATILFIKVK